MKYEITRIHSKALAKLFVIIYFALGLVASFTSAIIMIIDGRDFLLILPTFIAPFLGSAVGGVTGFFISLVYNFAARKFGGAIFEGKALTE